MTILVDEFRGNDAHLVRCIEAEISLSDRAALVPHGLGGHARAMLSAAAVRLTVRWHFVAMCSGDPPLVIPCRNEFDVERAVRMAMMGEPDAACLDDDDNDMVMPIVTNLLTTGRNGLEDGDFYLTPVTPGQASPPESERLVRRGYIVAREIVESLRESSVYVDEEGEDTEALEAFLDAIKAEPAKPGQTNG